MDIPVYLIAGFLDSGKTGFINGILRDGFAEEDRTDFGALPCTYLKSGR